MGNGQSLAGTVAFPAPGTAAAAVPAPQPVTGGGAGGGAGAGAGKCPVDHGKSAVAPQAAAPSSSSSSSAGKCPVDHSNSKSKGNNGEQYKNPKSYNVYGQELDPKNMIPNNLNQQPAPGQSEPLDTERVQSHIPKGGSDGTWTYPSPQMFYNALTRKGKGEGVKEHDMSGVVAIHNNMNERAWAKIAAWEKLHCDECPDSRLLRFRGRPTELTPKARLKTWLGYPVPFDRHDWIIDRCGKEVRYVIDYYYDSHRASDDKTPSLHDTGAVKSIDMDARPALDSVGSVLDRLKALPARLRAGWSAHKPVDDSPTDHTRQQAVIAMQGGGSSPAAAIDSNEAHVSPPAVKIADNADDMTKDCAQFAEALATASTPQEQARANFMFTLCVGKYMCPGPTAELRKAIETTTDDSELAEPFQKIQDCIQASASKPQQS